MSETRDQRLAATFVALADTLVDDFDLLDYLTLLAERCEELLDVDAAGVILSDQRGGWRPIAASTEQAELVELFAAQTREGPCHAAVTTGQPVTSADLGTDDRWPQFSGRATRAGFHAAAALPMRLRTQIIGSLTLLNATATGVGDTDIHLGQSLADMATIGLLQQHAGTREELLVHQLQAAQQHRILLEQARRDRRTRPTCPRPRLHPAARPQPHPRPPTHPTRPRRRRRHDRPPTPPHQQQPAPTRNTLTRLLTNWLMGRPGCIQIPIGPRCPTRWYRSRMARA